MEDEIKKELAQAAKYYDIIVEFFVNYSFSLLGAILILVVGYFVARKVSNSILHLCKRKELDITLSRFVASVVKIIVFTMFVIIALSKLGISITPFIAAVGALSLGAGLAVQGLLANYGAGLNIIIARPFVVGDTIQVQGIVGLVEEVHLAFTILTNEDQVRITIPNKHIIGEILHNSFADTLVEAVVGVSYATDPQYAITIIEKVLAGQKELEGKRAPLIGIDEFADSAINIGIRYWASTVRYHETRYSVNLAIHTALKEAGIDIPFPQRDVHLIQAGT
ncbi:Small-conductance mechanosensitive channel [Thalassocella blandensis]|nr:Small-conductance mechanosensitive channel [Thalassocella blandensis]